MNQNHPAGNVLCIWTKPVTVIPLISVAEHGSLLSSKKNAKVPPCLVFYLEYHLTSILPKNQAGPVEKAISV